MNAARHYCPSSLTLITFLLLASISFSVSGANTHHPVESFEFALIGDMPYGIMTHQPHPEFTKLTAAINAHPRLQWLLHAGDIKSSREPCSDELYKIRRTQLNQFKIPVILTPGDNDWTDCHRRLSGGYAPLERLNALRAIFYPEPERSLGGTTMKLSSQASQPDYAQFPENVRWLKQNVVFATLHIVGSHNGLASFENNGRAKRGRQDDLEVEQRTAAALAWLRDTFAIAKDKGSPGVFLMIHANPGLEPSSKNHRARAPFKTLLKALEEEIIAFARPVVLAHGDSHYFRIDKPALADAEFLTHFTRVETFGSPWLHWIRVVVTPQSPAVFTFFPEIVPD